MSFTDPPVAPPAAVPIPNRLTDDQVAFDAKTDTYLNWLSAFRVWTAGLIDWLRTFLAELASAQQGIEDNRIAAQRAAAAAETSAASAAVVAGAARWAPGDYEQGDAVWSPMSLLTYRRRPEGVTHSAVDPSLDSAGWRSMGGSSSLPQQRLTTAGPHALATGMHYLVEHPAAECLMPAGAVESEALRITNQTGARAVILRANGGTFDGAADDMVLDDLTADRIFTWTATRGWI